MITLLGTNISLLDFPLDISYLKRSTVFLNISAFQLRMPNSNRVGGGGSSLRKVKCWNPRRLGLDDFCFSDVCVCVLFFGEKCFGPWNNTDILWYYDIIFSHLCRNTIRFSWSTRKHCVTHQVFFWWKKSVCQRCYLNCLFVSSRKLSGSITLSSCNFPASGHKTNPIIWQFKHLPPPLPVLPNHIHVSYATIIFPSIPLPKWTSTLPLQRFRWEHPPWCLERHRWNPCSLE